MADAGVQSIGVVSPKNMLTTGERVFIQGDGLGKVRPTYRPRLVHCGRSEYRDCRLRTRSLSVATWFPARIAVARSGIYGGCLQPTFSAGIEFWIGLSAGRTSVHGSKGLRRAGSDARRKL